MTIRSTLRTLRREPGFFTLATVTLALGVAAVLTVFGMVDQLLLRPVPGVPDPDGVAYLQLRTGGAAESAATESLNQSDFETLRESATLLGGMASQGFVVVPPVHTGVTGWGSVGCNGGR